MLIALLMVVHFGVTRFPSARQFDLEDPAFLDSISQILTTFQDSISLKTNSIRSFDPNTVAYDSLVSWGLRTFVAANIIKYREAGGRFGRPEDLKKLFGMTDSIWLALSPWIDLQPVNLVPNANKQTPQRQYSKERTHQNPTRKDLNQVDSVWLKSIYGIGPVLSKRIVKYRNLLGGFYSTEQLNEVYGLSPEALSNLKEKIFVQSDTHLSKINLNTEDFKRIASHPYISFNLAKAIINYRDQHGAFNSVEEIKKIHIINDSTYLRVYPYLDF